MAFSQGSRSRLSVAAESSFGVLPTSPTFATLPVKKYSLDLDKVYVPGEDIRSDRMQAVGRHGTRSVSGSIEVDLRREDYDDLLESLFFSTFDSNDHLTVGTTPKYLRFEDAALDITKYRQFSGCVVNSATFNIAVNQAVQATFEIVGRDMATSGSSLGSPSAASTYEPFDSFTGTLMEGGVGSGDSLCIVSALQFSINNDVTPAHVILCEDNVDLAAQLEYGMATIEGTMTVYYTGTTLIDKFLNETSSVISATVNDATGTNDYTFYFPNVLYTGAKVSHDPKSRLIELPFKALRGTGGTPWSLRVTRTS